MQGYQPKFFTNIQPIKLGGIFMKINRNSHVPMYRQIADDLQRKIQERVYETGEQLPTEPLLMQEYQVSRITIRKAINLLTEDRLITIQRGKGMFVNAPTIETDVMNDVMNIDNFKGFYETLIDQGIDVRVRFLEFSEQIPPKNIAEILNSSTETKLRTIERIFYIKDLPIAYHIVYLSQNVDEVQQEIIDKLAEQPLSKLIQEKFQIEEIRCSLEVKKTPKHIADLLNIPPGYPLLTLSRTFIEKSKPYIVSLMYLSSDSYQFTIKNKSDGSSAK